jgi:hypothetical protein
MGSPIKGVESCGRFKSDQSLGQTLRTRQTNRRAPLQIAILKALIGQGQELGQTFRSSH